MSELTANIAHLATGNELVLGDIVNTNGQTIVRELVDAGFWVGSHVITSDHESEIMHGLQFLLQHYQIIIITGGLGPTSDDRTRFALSKTLNVPLVTHTESLQKIAQRLAKYNLPINEGNQQQALFPKDAIILDNPHGTAAGCAITWQDKLIFMLPGPPHECLPMFRNHIMPLLWQNFPTANSLTLKWRLFGAIEGQIAAELDTITKPYGDKCVTGYRLDFPYIEIKLHTQKSYNLTDLIYQIEQLIKPYQLSHDNQKASTLLMQKISEYKKLIYINDLATGGLLANTITAISTKPFLCFNSEELSSPAFMKLTVSGLNEYWNGVAPSGESSLTLQLEHVGRVKHIQELIPYRNAFIRKYAVEYIAWKLTQWLTEID